MNFGFTVCEILIVEIQKKKLLSQQKYQNSVFLRVHMLLMVTQNPIIHGISDARKYFAQIVTDNDNCHKKY